MDSNSGIFSLFWTILSTLCFTQELELQMYFFMFSEISQPFIKDKYGDDLGDTAIGNGSVCNVQFMERPWEYAGKSGITATLVGVQVMDLVEYSGGLGDEFTYVEKPTAEITETETDEDKVPF